jgi:hypothetical protein
MMNAQLRPASDEPAPAVPSPKAYILRGFIYATPHTLDFEGEPSWWVRHGFRLGLMLALLLHFSFLGYLAYRTFIAPFEVEVVEREYDVDWITLTDPRYKPLPNPESWVAPPADQPAKPDAQARAAALARRKREEEEARRRAEAERQRREAEREAEARPRCRTGKPGTPCGRTTQARRGRPASAKWTSGPSRPSSPSSTASARPGSSTSKTRTSASRWPSGWNPADGCRAFGL